MNTEHAAHLADPAHTASAVDAASPADRAAGPADRTPIDRAAAGLIDYLAASPSPFHACATSARLLRAAGFIGMTESLAWPLSPGRYYLIRGGTLVAWSTERASGPATPFRVVGAHTDSPNLRIKPQPDLVRAGFTQLGVEVYGGPLLNSWLDRDLGLSGRVSVRAAALDSAREKGELPEAATAADPAPVMLAESEQPAGVATVLLHINDPILRVAQLAVHLDRGVNADGLKLNPQQHLSPIWGLGDTTREFRAFLAERMGVDPEDVLAWDVMTHDTQPPARIGAVGEFVAGGRMDNLATSFAGTQALIAAVERLAMTGSGPSAASFEAPPEASSEGPFEFPNEAMGGEAPPIPLLVLFDHEEVGSVSERGAQSSLLTTVMERIVLSRKGSREEFHRAMAATVIASGDMAHATHPNYADKHEPEHRISIGGGPVLKVNNQLRYATGAPGAAAFALACEQAAVPMQQFVTRSDLPCGSTVGPVTAARTGAQTVDFGAPMLSMHSARELVGAADQAMYADALAAFLAPEL